MIRTSSGVNSTSIPWPTRGGESAASAEGSTPAGQTADAPQQVEIHASGGRFSGHVVHHAGGDQLGAAAGLHEVDSRLLGGKLALVTARARLPQRQFPPRLHRGAGRPRGDKVNRGRDRGAILEMRRVLKQIRPQRAGRRLALRGGRP